MTEHFLDCKGIRCPMPIVKVYKKFATLALGDTLEVDCDDLAFSHDIKAWCQQVGQELVELKRGQSIVSVKLKKIKA